MSLRFAVNEFGPIFEETNQFPVGPLDESQNYREFSDRSLHYLQDSASIHATLIVSGF